MTETASPKRTLYLHLSKDGDFIFTTSKTSNVYSPHAHFPWPDASKLDFTMVDDMTVTFEIGDSMPNWEFMDDPETQSGQPKNKPIRFPKGVDKAPGKKEVQVKTIASGAKKKFGLKFVKSAPYDPATGDGYFKFYLYLNNDSGGHGVTVTLDPGGGNKGGNPQPP